MPRFSSCSVVAATFILTAVTTLAEGDTDGDGAFSLSELQAIRPELTEERFARVDRNGDGLISEDERPRRGPRQRDGRGQDRPGSDETAL